MKDFADIVNKPYEGTAKTQAEIAATTSGKNPRPANYVAHQQLPEWEPAVTQLSRDEFLRQVIPLGDRIVVQLIDDPQQGRIVLTDRKQLISGDLRKAIVLKTGPGRWISGDWYCSTKELYAGDGKTRGNLLSKQWEWYPGYRRAVDLLAGQTVWIGNWVDLELDDIALCAEGDVRIWRT